MASVGDVLFSEDTDLGQAVVGQSVLESISGMEGGENVLVHVETSADSLSSNGVVGECVDEEGTVADSLMITV